MIAFTFILWFIIGCCYLLSNRDYVSKPAYFCVWVVLMHQLIMRM